MSRARDRGVPTGSGGAERGGGPAPVVGLVAVTAAGRAAAAELATAWPGGTRTYPGPAAEALPRAFAECDTVVAFVATGVAVRVLAPHLGDKGGDPGVVCVDEGRRFAVALLGGHAGGANELAARAAEVLGCEPVITTASEATGVPALDGLGATMGWRIEPGGDRSKVGAAVLSGEPVSLVADRTWPLPPLPANVTRARQLRERGPAIVVTDRVPALPGGRPLDQDVKFEDCGASGPTAVVDGAAEEADLWTASGEPVVVYRPDSLVVGVGASSGAPAGEVLRLVERALAEAGLSRLSVRRIATVEVKAAEPGLVETAAVLGVPLVSYPAERLAAVGVPNPSEIVRSEVGTPSVAEAAALCVDGPVPPPGEACGEATGETEDLSRDVIVPTSDPASISAGEPAPSNRPELLVDKRKSANATVAVARHAPRGRLALVGLGPGARDLLTPRATAELRRCSVVVGLDQYVHQIRDLLRPGTRVLASGLGEEEQRARTAAGEAARGHAVALIGSGDAGVYAMASPALEAAGADVDVVGVPGVTAALAASNLLGAPLGHDHAIISLSDLHTPWQAIEGRVRAAAGTDLVVAFYNPRSGARDWQLPAALRILAEHRPPGTPVGYVRAATRTGQRVTLTTLAQAGGSEADMMTLVVVGSTATRVVAGRMVTPRGYAWSDAGTCTEAT